MNTACIGCKQTFVRAGDLFICRTCAYSTQPIKWLVATKIGCMEHEASFIPLGMPVVPIPAYMGFGEVGGSLVCMRATIQPMLLNLMYLTSDYHSKIEASTHLKINFIDVANDIRQMLVWIQNQEVGAIIVRDGSNLKVLQMPYA